MTEEPQSRQDAGATKARRAESCGRSVCGKEPTLRKVREGWGTLKHLGAAA